jgi:hypothetical protein
MGLDLEIKSTVPPSHPTLIYMEDENQSKQIYKQNLFCHKEYILLSNNLILPL